MTTIRDYRFKKDCTPSAGLYKEEYPQYFSFISELQSKFYDMDSTEVTMGVDYDVYRDLTRIILNKRPKHIIEYGSGFTTAYIQRVIQDLDYTPYFVSYENVPYFFDKAKEMGLDPNGCMELVDMTIEDRDDLYYCTYQHDLHIHRDVDFVFIDGPGHVSVNEVRKPNINLNLEIFVKSFNRNIRYLIDGRDATQQYYRKIYKSRGWLL